MSRNVQNLPRNVKPTPIRVRTLPCSSTRRLRNDGAAQQRGERGMQDHYDVLIIGAGLSGIGMACHLMTECPDQRFAILERRQAIGGTWDLFRYPGIRSDSDMFSFGYGFRPWNELKVLADGPSIRKYVSDTAREYGVDRKIQFGLKVVRADWSSAQQRWTVDAVDEAGG